MSPQGTNLTLNEDVKILDEAAQRFGTFTPDGRVNRSAAARAILREWDRDKDLYARLVQIIDSWPAVHVSARTARKTRKPAANRRTVTA